MLLKLRLLAISISSGLLLIIVLCLGSQNLKIRHNVNLGLAKTAPLPSGFLIGISLALGVISGGSTKTLLIKTQQPKE
tara:strand:+ start:1993 stop:2226 length:234 start_codon:yes stop_codon:yes gene_type:complete